MKLPEEISSTLSKSSCPRLLKFCEQARIIQNLIAIHTLKAIRTTSTNIRSHLVENGYALNNQGLSRSNANDIDLGHQNVRLPN